VERQRVWPGAGGVTDAGRGRGSSPAFRPPTAEQVARHLGGHRVAPPSPLPGRLMLAAVVLGVLIDVVGGLALGSLLALAGVAGLVGLVIWRRREAAALVKEARRVQELAMLRHHRAAIRRAWRLLPRLTALPVLHHRLIAVLAHSLDRARAFDAATACIDELLETLAPDSPAAVPLRVQRANLVLLSDRLAEGDEALRRLRGRVETLAGTPAFAAYRMAQLVQHVRTHHFGDAVALAGDLRLDLQPLGVDAGYGHGLMALCYQSRAEAGDADREQAQRWWSSATLLLPPGELASRFPELTPLTLSR